MARTIRREQIRELPFRHGARPNLGVEAFRLSELYARADRAELDHALETPQRPEFHTLYVGLRGQGRLVVDFTPVPLGARWLTVVARGRVQQFVPDRGVDAWMILVEPATIVGSSLLAPSWPEPAIELPAADRKELIALAEQIAAEQSRPPDRVQSPLLATLVSALLLRAERLQTGWTVPDGPLQQFFTILERDHLRTRSVAHYAKHAAISPRRLGELLLAHTGKSTKQVIDERVVLECKRLLVHTDLTVKQLADRTGFAEPTNLVKFFRHHTQQTPLAFRAATRTFLPSGRRS
ncbi:MAG TPA: helix-turn-helix domain-containing protein [Kofleriaceae bacterium]|nr:helix-turn-helix domain-containing protein [Kofleriaceae bacterium]